MRGNSQALFFHASYYLRMPGLEADFQQSRFYPPLDPGVEYRPYLRLPVLVRQLLDVSPSPFPTKICCLRGDRRPATSHVKCQMSGRKARLPIEPRQHECNIKAPKLPGHRRRRPGLLGLGLLRGRDPHAEFGQAGQTWNEIHRFPRGRSVQSIEIYDHDGHRQSHCRPRQPD